MGPVDIAMHIHTPTGEIFRSGDDRREAICFVSEFFAFSAAARHESKPDAVVLEPFAGGRNAAYVLKLTPRSSIRDAVSRQDPVVLKITAREKGRQESAAYEEFVRPSVPTSFRAELLWFAEGNQYSALFYRFVSAATPNFRTITDHIQSNHLHMIDYLLNGLIMSLSRTWYHRTSVKDGTNIVGHYVERYFRDGGRLSDNNDTFSRIIDRFKLQKKHGGLELGGHLIVTPLQELSRRGNQGYKICIQHGDLNTDNILVGEDFRSTILIDFEKTGWGHVYEDFVALEFSIRINYPPNPALEDILQQERHVSSGLLPDWRDPYVAAIRKIRMAAFGHFGSQERSWTYHFAVVAIGLRLMQATDLSEIARARIAAAMLWALRALAPASSA
jgi:hypothetical protein